MKMINKKTLYICLFSILYLFTAFVSTTHAISFFSLANVSWMAIMLAITFEIGQAAVLFSILTNKNNEKKIMPWCLMCVLTLVQILGNVFSSYKYVMKNSIEDLKYFKEPIFVWTDLPDNITTVIVTYLLGAILPVICLLLTSMVTGYLDDSNKTEETEDNNNEQSEEIERLKAELEEERNKPLPEPEVKEVEKEIEKIVEVPVEKEVIKEVPVEVEKIVDNPEQAAEIERLKAELEEEKNKVKEEEVPEKESHFVNI